jgi:phosphate transport system substrate-binding protein
MNRLLVLASLTFLLAACGAPQVSTPAPTPQAIDLTFPPDLQPWADKLSGCASSNPLTALYFNPSSPSEAGILPNDIVLALGQPVLGTNSTYLSQVGREQIDVIVNRDNPVSQLSTAELRSIFSGQQATWNNASTMPIQVWVLPEADPLRVIFDQTVLQSLPLASNAMLAPDPTAMLEAISKDVNSIGYLPASFLNSTGTVDPGVVQIVQLDQSLVSTFDQPVVALTLGEPQGLVRSLLVCLESDTP